MSSYSLHTDVYKNFQRVINNNLILYLRPIEYLGQTVVTYTNRRSTNELKGNDVVLLRHIHVAWRVSEQSDQIFASCGATSNHLYTTGIERRSSLAVNHFLGPSAGLQTM